MSEKKHIHTHTHHHNHHHAPETFNRAFAVAFLFNASFTVFQIIFAFLAGSMSLLADGVHNLGDVFGLALAWGANWLLTLPPKKRYSYGFKRTTIMAAMINAFILVATSALISYESIYKLFHFSEVNSSIVIIVASIGILINGGSALLFMRGAHDDLNVKGAFLHLLGDALISIGVVVSAIVLKWTHWVWLDPLVGLLIVLIILIGTWGLLRDSVRLILDAIPHRVDVHAIENYLQSFSGVKAIHDLHIWGLSTKENALTVHLIMPNHKLTDAQFREINQTLKNKFHINHATIQVESGSNDHPCVRIEKC